MSEFRDGIYLKYEWEPTNIPLTPACGQSFERTHALHCAKGGYAHMRHDEIKDTLANLMSEVCYDVEIEPKLQSLQGESFINNSTTSGEDARLDVKANGLWGSRFSRPSLLSKSSIRTKNLRRLMKDAYKYHESLKNSKYLQRVLQVERSSFFPLICGCTGGSSFCPLICVCTCGAAPSDTRTMQRIAENLVKKGMKAIQKQ